MSLKRTVYRLNQSPQAWFKRFTSSVITHSFFKWKKRKTIVLIVYVDDNIITRNDHDEKDNLKASLTQAFDIKDLRQFSGSYTSILFVVIIVQINVVQMISLPFQ